MARMAQAQIEEFNPIAEINTTPLIDLMLVLLVMFIIIVPVSTHKIEADLPTPSNDVVTPPPAHRLDIDAGGRLFWDGTPIAADALRQRLGAMVADPAQPVLQMNAHDETRYERFDEVLGIVRRAGVTRLGFVGMNRFEGQF